jgi:hypothetical protein
MRTVTFGSPQTVIWNEHLKHGVVRNGESKAFDLTQYCPVGKIKKNEMGRVM